MERYRRDSLPADRTADATARGPQSAGSIAALQDNSVDLGFGSRESTLRVTVMRRNAN